MPPTAASKLSGLSRGTWTTFLYGASRPVVGRCGWALARAVNPAPFWFDIRAPGRPADPGTPTELGWVDPARLAVIESSEARPQRPPGPRALSSVVRTDESGAELTDLTEFLRLPARLQELVSASPRPVERPVLVVANSDRVRPFYPRDAGGVRRILDVLVHQGFSAIFTATPPPGPGRMAFDLVLEIQEPGTPRARLSCEKAPEASGFTAGTVHPLAAFPELDSAAAGRP